MANILHFPVPPRERFGFKPVRKKKPDAGERAQLDLFRDEQENIIQFPLDRSLFDIALLCDEQGEENAVALYKRAIEEGDHVADAYCNLGIIESKNGNTSKAFDCFTRSLKEDPRHFESHYNLGNLYFDAGNYTLSRTHYEMAAEINPMYEHLHFNLALVCALDEEYSCAIDALKRYLRLISTKDSCAEELLRSLQSVAG